MSVLGYWNIQGFAQGIRFMLAYVGEEVEERRYNFGPPPGVSMDEWMNEKFTLGLDFPNLPYYKDGTVNISQSYAILRYLSRKYQMPECCTRLDLAEEEIKDLRKMLTTVCYNRSEMNVEEGKRDFVTNYLPVKLKQWEAFLGDRQWLAGDKISYVDFDFYANLEIVYLLGDGCLQGYTKLTSYMQRFKTLPKIKEYMESDMFLKEPIWSPGAKLLG